MSPLFISTIHLNPNIDLIKYLVEVGKADVNIRNFEGEFPLSVSCSKNQTNLEVIQSIISGKAEINQKNYQGDTALAISCSMRNISYDLVKLLIENKADVNTKNLFENSPLLILCSNEENNPIIVKYLIKNKAKLNNKNKKDQTPIDAACNCQNISLEVIRILIKNETKNLRSVFNSFFPKNKLENRLKHDGKYMYILKGDVFQDYGKGSVLYFNQDNSKRKKWKGEWKDSKEFNGKKNYCYFYFYILILKKVSDFANGLINKMSLGNTMEV